MTECCGWLTVQYSFDTVRKGSLIWFFLLLLLLYSYFVLCYCPPGMFFTMSSTSQDDNNYTDVLTTKTWTVGRISWCFWSQSPRWFLGKNSLFWTLLVAKWCDRSCKHMIKFCSHEGFLLCTTRNMRGRLGHIMQRIKYVFHVN